MRKQLILTAAACVSCCMSCLEAKEEPAMDKKPLVYRVGKLSEPIEIDADWNKPAWEKIKPLTINKYMGEKPEHLPGVQAKLAWDGESLCVIFRVEDRYVRAVAKEYQGDVYKDSCVEFFFTPGPSLGLSYFNLETNCGGTMLFRWNPSGKSPTPVSAQDGKQIEIAHSLPKTVDPEIQEPTTWTLEYRLPFDMIQKYCPEAAKPGPGVVWKANFYKCADESSRPHWMTWSFVDNPTPKFHVPQCFGSLEFE